MDSVTVGQMVLGTVSGVSCCRRSCLTASLQLASASLLNELLCPFTLHTLVREALVNGQHKDLYISADAIHRHCCSVEDLFLPTKASQSVR